MARKHHSGAPKHPSKGQNLPRGCQEKIVDSSGQNPLLAAWSEQISARPFLSLQSCPIQLEAQTVAGKLFTTQENRSATGRGLSSQASTSFSPFPLDSHRSRSHFACGLRPARRESPSTDRPPMVLPIFGLSLAGEPAARTAGAGKVRKVPAEGSRGDSLQGLPPVRSLAVCRRRAYLHL